MHSAKSRTFFKGLAYAVILVELKDTAVEKLMGKIL